MKQALVERLDAYLKRDPVLVATPPLVSEVDKIELFAAFRLPADYRAFVERFGAAILGPFSVYGIGASDAMGAEEASVIEVTKRFRRDNWPGTEAALVISMDHAGNAITLNANGHVHRFDHDFGRNELLAHSFESFALNLCSIV